MPRGDRTGPMGMGGMTGRGAGYCAGFGVRRGCENPVLSRGYGTGSIRGGGGRGRRNHVLMLPASRDGCVSAGVLRLIDIRRHIRNPILKWRCRHSGTRLKFCESLSWISSRNASPKSKLELQSSKRRISSCRQQENVDGNITHWKWRHAYCTKVSGTISAWDKRRFPPISRMTALTLRVCSAYRFMFP